MRADVCRDMTQSTKAFVELAWPAISPLIEGGYFRTLENVDDTGDLLDQISGFDGLQIARLEGVEMTRGIACRMQPVMRPWDTFTIRESRVTGAMTEYEKRLATVRQKWGGWVSPKYVIQGYYCEESWRLLSVGAVCTTDLMIYIHRDMDKRDKRGPRVTRKTNTGDGNGFISVPWQHLIEDGVPVYIARG